MLAGYLHPRASRRRGPLCHLGDGALGHHPPAVEDQDPVAHLLHLREQVGAEDDGDAVLTGDPADQVEHLELTRRIQPQGRLVQKDHLRVVDQGPGDAEPLPHPPAVRRNPRPAAIPEADLVEEPPGGGARIGRGPSEEPGVEGQPLLGGLGGGVAGALRQYAEAPPDLQRPGVRHAGDREGARVGRQHRGEHPDHGRLARSVGTEEPHDAPGIDLEAQRLDGDHVAVRLAQTLGLQSDIAGHLHLVRRSGPITLLSRT